MAKLTFRDGGLVVEGQADVEVEFYELAGILKPEKFPDTIKPLAYALYEGAAIEGGQSMDITCTVQVMAADAVRGIQFIGVEPPTFQST